jgi:MerR family transcriptional regulator, repressor of the yfmOP operon
VSATSLRIGEVAELTNTTPRTIRYYEEIGLLPGATDRAQGKHRAFTEGDVERVREILRLRDLLGLSLDELSKVLEADAARAELRREYRATDDPAKQGQILEQSLHHIGTQLELVSRRRAELQKLEQELVDKRREVQGKLKKL